MQRKGLGWVSVLAVCSLIGSCDERDAVADVAVTSFDSLVERLGDKVAWNEDEGSWQLTAPDGDRFLIAKDFSRPNKNGEGADFELDLKVDPFLSAGLNPARLPSSAGLGYRVEQGRLPVAVGTGSGHQGGALPVDTPGISQKQ